MNIRARWFKVALMLIVGGLSGGIVSQAGTVEAFSPIYYNNTNYNGANIHYIQVDLYDAGTFITPIGAGNHLPKYNAWDPEPRWDDNQAHIQDLLQMYNGAPFSDKVALINTDYFCRSGCTGNAGAPQGMFVRDGTKYQWPGPHKRSALRFDSSNVASIGVYGPYSAPDPSNTSSYRQIVSGGPVTLLNGTVTCNPYGEDVPSSHCGSNIYRTAACVSSDGRTLWLFATATQTSWSNLANFMKARGCSNGMEFDSGSSTGMVYKGLYKVSPASVGTGLLIRYRSGCPCGPVSKPTSAQQ